MPTFKSFPHYQIDIKDESVRTPLVTEQLSLHRPMMLGLAEKGPVGVPVYGPYETLKTLFGAGTFDEFSKFYKHSSLFLTKALTKQPCFFVRLADATAKAATMVLECSIYNVGVVQYQKDVNGFRLVDTNTGDFIPVDNGGSPLVEPGITVKWSVRPLGATETMTGITQSSSTIPDPFGGADLTVTTFPIMAFTASSPGAWGNVTGIKLSWDDASDAATATDMESLIFKAELVTVPWGVDSPQTIRNKYLETATEFTFKENTVDTDTMRRYAFGEILVNEYNEDEIPFTHHVYAANVSAIGASAIAVEDTVIFPELLDEAGNPAPFMVNLITGKTLDGHYYDHIAVDFYSVGAVMLDADIIQYMSGGDDGNTDDATYEGLTRTWLSGSVYPEIVDSARYPITHIYDSGYEIETKEALIDFLGLRDDVKLSLSTQSVYEEANDKEMDQSTGSYLRARVLLHIESILFGTEACRATIYQQCGKLTEFSNYTNLVPATIDAMQKKGTWHNATYIKGKPKGLPNSAVTIIKDVNWFPVQDEFKQLSWDNALNYMQFYDRTSVHYPDVISVYAYKTSLLSDDLFVDYMVYLKHLVRQEWAKFVGLDDPITELFGKITASLTRTIYDTFGSYIRAEVEVYQTDLDAELGYALTVKIAVYGTVPNRVWNVIIPVRREVAA